MTGDSVGSQSRSRAVLAHVLASAPACGEVSRLLCHAAYIRSSELDQYVFHVKPSRDNISLALTAQEVTTTMCEQVPVRQNDPVTHLVVSDRMRLCPSRDGWSAHCDASYGPALRPRTTTLAGGRSLYRRPHCAADAYYGRDGGRSSLQRLAPDAGEAMAGQGAYSPCGRHSEAMGRHGPALASCALLRRTALPRAAHCQGPDRFHVKHVVICLLYPASERRLLALSMGPHVR